MKKHPGIPITYKVRSLEFPELTKTQLKEYMSELVRRFRDKEYEKENRIERALYDADGKFCALGCASNLANELNYTESRDYGSLPLFLEECDLALTPELAERATMDSTKMFGNARKHFFASHEYQIITLNDHGVSWATIADIIEYNFNCAEFDTLD